MWISRVRAAALTGLIVLASGCGGGGSSPAVTAPKGATTGPHGGVAIPLPDDKGYAEVVIERDATKRKTGKAKVPSKLAVYFLNSELKGPLSPVPTDTTIKAILPTGDTPSVPLQADPKSGDPTGAGRVASAPGDFDYDELSGEVTATVDGQSVSLPFAFR